jgi:hypothetical protein
MISRGHTNGPGRLNDKLGRARAPTPVATSDLKDIGSNLRTMWW